MEDLNEALRQTDFVEPGKWRISSTNVKRKAWMRVSLLLLHMKRRLTMLVIGRLADALSFLIEDGELESSKKIEEFIARHPRMPTAKRLKESIVMDRLPSFGFAKVSCYEEETCLMGLYKALLMDIGMPAHTDLLQRWQETDKLGEGICRFFERQDYPSAYYHWFKKNQHYVSKEYQNPNGPFMPGPAPTQIDVKKLGALLSEKDETEGDSSSIEGEADHDNS